MITTLHIKNIGIIDDLTVELNEGLNILTGETGAGKTLIIDSLEIAAGGRFSKEMIRHGCDHSFVELNIYAPDNGLALDGNIIITREIFSNGRNSCKINGRLVTVSELKEMMKKIVDIHGQNDNQLLLEPKYHITYLDNYSGDEILKIKAEYRKLYNEYNDLKTELQNNYGDDKEKERKLDLLKYELNEIESSNLKKGEDEELENKRKLIINSKKIEQNLNNIKDNLSNQIIDGLSNSIHSLEKIEELSDDFKGKLEKLKEIYYDIQEISREFEYFSSNIEFDEYEIDNVENRLDMINSLKRKYGNTIEEILEYHEYLKKQIYEIENLDEYINSLKQQIFSIEQQMTEKAKKMEEIRKKYAEKLSSNINKELKELEMFNSNIQIKIENLEGFNSNGINKVEFFITTNIGDIEKPLAKIASGGEMSRIMLAIKTVIASTDEVPILIFDEIDTGISGKAAKAVGEKLKLISKMHQVICITHLAQIAAKGDHNYYISKKVEDDKTTTNIRKLEEEEIIDEIARISSGEITEISRSHARELRK